MIELEHTADVAYTATAGSIERLFELAAEGLARAVGTRPAREGGGAPSSAAEAGEPRDLRLRRPDLERLLVAWLRELLPGIQAGAAPEVVRLRVLPGPELEATVAWRTVGVPPPVREIKGITYHGLVVRRAGDRWTARVVLDV